MSVITTRPNKRGFGANHHKTLRRLVLPTELRQLDDLQAYLRRKGNYPLIKVGFKYKKYATIAPRYLPRVQFSDEGLQTHIDTVSHQPAFDVIATK